jgi:hypothetical protein
MNIVTYEQARNLIQDGDLVFVKKGKSIWSKLTQLVTKSDVYHCGIAFWVRDPVYKSRLFIVEAFRGGRRIVSLSSYAKHPIDIIGSPISWEKNCDEVLDNTGLVPYSIPEYVWIGLRELLRIKRDDADDDYGEVCSKMVAKYLVRGGVMLETDISPGKLEEKLLQMQFDFRFRITNDTVK